jgi:hypothetical protein
MKKLWILFLCLPLVTKAQFKIVNTSTINLVELRSGTWPINLQRVCKENDTAYQLLFRDQEFPNEVIMTNLRFHDMDQLKYFQRGLTALKNGTNGDEAKFKDYSIKRVDVKKEGTWYILDLGDGALTNFQQPEADKLIAAIVNL